MSTSFAGEMNKRSGTDDVMSADGKGPKAAMPEPNIFSSLLVILKCMLLNAIAPTLVSTEQKTTITRSAVFLVVFLVFHVAGNITVFGGPDLFNTYGHHLHHMPGLVVVECYLLVAALVHTALGVYQTFTNKFKAKKLGMKGGKLTWSATHTQLALSGTVLSVFLVVHVLSFRFGPVYNKTIEGVGEVRDMYRVEREVFSDPKQVAFYTVAVMAVGVHLWRGWANAVNSPALAVPMEHRPNALVIGHLLAVVACLGFAACPIFVHLNPSGASNPSA